MQIGAAYWLHMPLGQLRTGRYIPFAALVMSVTYPGSTSFAVLFGGNSACTPGLTAWSAITNARYAW